jgi:hypothetical protein
MKLIEKIDGAEHYIKRFSEWEATEQIIDDTKAFWCLKKPDSQYQKVCLYRDGCNMFIYGDYGQFTFDSMTWRGDVYNLEYDNIGYQMEKLNYDSKQSLKVFDEYKCREDIFDWLRERLENRYDIAVNIIEKVVSFIKDNSYIIGSELEEFCQENECDELSNIIEFACECLENVDEYDWISFLRNKSFQEFDEECESSLWNAGKCIHQRYFICMYALQVCGEKLLAAKGEK